MLLGGGRDADSGVPHGKSQRAGFRFEICDFRFEIFNLKVLHTDHDFPVLGELDGVAGQIEQDLLQFHPVADQRIRRLLRHAAGEAQPVLAGPHGKDVRYLLQHPPQAEGGRFQFQFARFDLGGVQQVVQERQEQVGRSPGGLQAVLDDGVQGLGQGQVDHAQDGIHGRAELVAHIGQELALGRVGGLGGFLGLLQMLLGLLAGGDLGLQGLVGCRQLLGPFLLADVDHGRTAASSLPLAARGGDALDQRINGLCVAKERDLAGLLGIGGQHAVAEIGKRAAVFQGHELPEALLHRGLSVQAQQGGPGQVDFQDPCLVVPEEIAHRGEVEELVILLRGLLGFRLARCNSSFCISSSIWWTCSSWTRASASAAAAAGSL